MKLKFGDKVRFLIPFFENWTGFIVDYSFSSKENVYFVIVFISDRRGKILHERLLAFVEDQLEKIE